VQDCYESAYLDHPFVDVMPAGSHPETRSVKGSNVCRIALHQATGSNKLVIISTIDNLNKGAAGQAVQNMNLMFGLDETIGLVMTGQQP
jgi:N-acetyl-gamma-glutamyl-phosphate reductase